MVRELACLLPRHLQLPSQRGAFLTFQNMKLRHPHAFRGDRVKTILRPAIPVLAGLLIAGTAAGLLGGSASAATAAAGRSAAAPVVTHSRSTADRSHRARRHARHGWPLVRQGARGERVVTIQYLLSARGYRIRVDGVFGPVTKADVRNFQKVRHLAADGVVRQRTWSRLILVVRLGSRGAGVRALQHSLRYAYHYKIAVDGIFGRVTRDTVRRFQARYHLVRDGIVGYRTWRALVRHER